MITDVSGDFRFELSLCAKLTEEGEGMLLNFHCARTIPVEPNNHIEYDAS